MAHRNPLPPCIIAALDTFDIEIAANFNRQDQGLVDSQTALENATDLGRHISHFLRHHGNVWCNQIHAFDLPQNLQPPAVRYDFHSGDIARLSGLIHSVHFIDKVTGRLMAENGWILLTNDQGLTIQRLCHSNSKFGRGKLAEVGAHAFHVTVRRKKLRGVTLAGLRIATYNLPRSMIVIIWQGIIPDTIYNRIMGKISTVRNLER